MNKICTSLEQSKKLIELGIDIKTADMCWSIDIPDLPTLLAYPITDCDNWENKIPAWSLSALLGLIPKPLLGQHLESGYWECTTWEDFNVVKEVHGQDNPLDAAFEMICWLKKENRI